LLQTNRFVLTSSLLLIYLVGAPTSPAGRVPKTLAHYDVETWDFADSLPRKVYAYSVVPGGVMTPEELAAARRSDPVVAKHFANWGARTWLTRLTKDEEVYVGYRQGNKTYYTKKKHKVCKGELVITDGTHQARTRCANIITRVFKVPNLVYHEPSPPALDSPAPEGYTDAPSDPLISYGTGYLPVVEPYQYGSGQTGAQPGPAPAPYAPPAGSEVILPQFLPFAGVGPSFFTPPSSTPPIVVVTPEPETVGMLLFGALLAGAAFRRFRGTARVS